MYVHKPGETKRVTGKSSTAKSSDFMLEGKELVKQATFSMLGGVTGMCSSDSEDDWCLELGTEDKSAIADIENLMGNDDEDTEAKLAIEDRPKKVKNDPDAISKVKARIQKLLGDCQRAKLQVRGALQNNTTKYFNTLKEKLGGAVEIIEASIDYFEGLTLQSDAQWQWMDLAELKKHAHKDINKINDFISTIKTLS